MERLLQDPAPAWMTLERAVSLHDGLRHLQRRPYDAVLLDVTRPGADNLRGLRDPANRSRLSGDLPQRHH